MPTEPDLTPHLLTPNALKKALAETPPTRRQNWALNRGGNVDVLTLGAPDSRTVLRLQGVKKLTPEIKKELAEILTRSGVEVAGREATTEETDPLTEAQPN